MTALERLDLLRRVLEWVSRVQHGRFQLVLVSREASKPVISVDGDVFTGRYVRYYESEDSSTSCVLSSNSWRLDGLQLESLTLAGGPVLDLAALFALYPAPLILSLPTPP